MDPPNALDLEAAYGGPGGLGGPNAGAGGKGADRYFYEVDQPNAPVYNRLSSAGMISYNDGPVVTNQGDPGHGVAQLGTLAAGPGGAPYPVVPPGDTNPTTTFWGSTNLSFANTIAVTNDCRSAMVAGPGGGGAYALDGQPGIPRSDTYTVTEVPQVLSTVPANTPGGSNSALNLEPPGEVVVRSLEHRLGLLRGGSGGGGGGAHFWGSRVLRLPAPSTLCNAASLVLPMWDHSAAGGGGGGGAFQGVSGREVFVGGVIDTSGGDGGSALANNAPLDNCRSGVTSADPNYPGLAPNIQACGSNATPGGGGSGGSLKLQGQSVTLADLPNRLSVAGGKGGVGVGGSTGGDGSPGLVRIEIQGFSGNQTTHADDFASNIEPFLPADGAFNTPFTSAAILSIGEFQVQRIRPDSFSSSMSCWMKPEGIIFDLDFASDDTLSPDDPDGKNWNMDLIYDDNGTERLFPYRGLPTGDPDFPLGSIDFETFLGNNQINHDLPNGQGSLISVHFQGARRSGALDDPCNVQLESPGGDIDPGSLTTWVTNPEDLNLFLPKPNMVRFVVVFEQALRSQGPVQLRIRGVTNLRIDCIVDWAGPGIPFCLGDGSAGACPCMNESALGHAEGCRNSTGIGARLSAVGTAAVADDDMQLSADQGPSGQPGVVIQGETPISLPFRDGILCMGFPTERLEILFLDALGRGITTGSIVNAGGVLPGDTRYYQLWYRDPGGFSPCGSDSNLSNGLIVTWY